MLIELYVTGRNIEDVRKMEGKIIKMDRRVQRTIRVLREALMALMMENGYEAITVQDIIDRADVGRSTFYAHFYDKEQLLINNIEDLKQQLRQDCSMQRLQHQDSLFRFSFSFGMLQHVEQNVRLYQATVGKNNGTIVLFHFKQMINELADSEISARYLFENLPKKVVLRFIVDTFFVLLQWWVEQYPLQTAEEIDEQFHRLVFNGINGISVTRE